MIFENACIFRFIDHKINHVVVIYSCVLHFFVCLTMHPEGEKMETKISFANLLKEIIFNKDLISHQ